jgi:enoyl-CoA hydratase/carnithine racemase
MTDSDAILYPVDEGVATISFNRPDNLNALTPAMLKIFFAKVDAD